MSAAEYTAVYTHSAAAGWFGRCAAACRLARTCMRISDSQFAHHLLGRQYVSWFAYPSTVSVATGSRLILYRIAAVGRRVVRPLRCRSALKRPVRRPPRRGGVDQAGQAVPEQPPPVQDPVPHRGRQLRRLPDRRVRVAVGESSVILLTPPVLSPLKHQIKVQGGMGAIK